MPALRLLAILGLTAIAGSDPAELVRRLGAPKYADRQSASAEIERVGARALPALRSAKVSGDAEVRSRVLALLTRIENDLMVRPTMVTLDFRDVPLSRAVSILGERGQISLSVAPGSRAAGDRRITLVESEPVPLWNAIERLGRAGGVELSGGVSFNMFGPGGIHAIPLVLMDSLDRAKPQPSSVSGPFRLSLVSLTHHKERIYAANAINNGMIGFGPNDGMMRIQQPDMGFGNGPGNLVGPEQFYATLQILAEPRMNVAMNGLPRLIEAVDDRGNSLMSSIPGTNSFLHNSGYNQYNEPGGPLVLTTLPLRFPEKAGRTIKRFRGVVPLTVTTRKDDPLVILLADAKGKTYHAAEMSITVNDVKPEPNSGQMTIDLTIQPAGGPADPNMGGLGASMAIVRGSASSQNPLEIVDAQGRPMTQWHILSHMPTAESSRITIRVISSPGTGPATHLRFHEFSRVGTEAEFEFLDVDMP